MLVELDSGAMALFAPKPLPASHRGTVSLIQLLKVPYRARACRKDMMEHLGNFGHAPYLCRGGLSIPRPHFPHVMMDRGGRVADALM